MIDMRLSLSVLLVAVVLSGCVAQELKMPWDRSAPAVEAPVQPEAKATAKPGQPNQSTALKSALVALPNKPSQSSVTDVIDPAAKVEKVSPAPVPAEGQPGVAAPTESSPPKVVEPEPVVSEVAPAPAADVSVKAAPEPAPATPTITAPPAPIDPMAEMREQARSAADAGEAEFAEALWQLIQQSLPDDAEAKDALAAIEKAKLKEAKAQGKVILLGENAAGWVVQVATFRADGREQAFEWLGKVRRAGYKPFLKTVEFPGRTLYRLRLGAYPERWMAEEVERRLLNNFPNEGLRPRIMQQDD